MSDSGAVADIAGSLAEAAAAHVAEVTRRVPGAQVVLQFDEPALGAVARGEIPTASGLSRIPAVDAAVMADRLGSVLAAVECYTVVHCCATAVPFGIIMDARPGGMAFDLSLLRREDGDSVAEAAERGMGILAGAVPALSEAGQKDEPADTARRVLRFWRRLGLAADQCAEQVVITPACGLAGAPPAAAKATLAHCRQAARMVPELAEEKEDGA